MKVYRLFNPFNDDLEQYVRITALEQSIEQFSYSNNGNIEVFEKRRIIMDISAPLIGLFHGGTPIPGGMKGDQSDIYSTQVADASRYYGIQSLSANVSQGDLSVKVQSVYCRP